MVEPVGIEPTTLGLQSRCSPSWAMAPHTLRTFAFCFISALDSLFECSCTCQYTPLLKVRLPWTNNKMLGLLNLCLHKPFYSSLKLVGLGGLEPPTPRLSSVCSNQLSYRPLIVHKAWLLIDFFVGLPFPWLMYFLVHPATQSQTALNSIKILRLSNSVIYSFSKLKHRSFLSILCLE